jgi:hypothetical protein
MVGCGKSEDKNTNANANTNIKTPTPMANQMSSGNDAEVQKKIEENLKAKGCAGVTVEVKNGVATARGTAPKGKLGDCMMAINEAKPGKVENQMTEAK